MQGQGPGAVRVWAGRHLPETHSLQTKPPSGGRGSPRQERWKAPQQAPSQSSRRPGFSHSWGQRAGEALTPSCSRERHTRCPSTSPRPLRPAPGRRTQPSPGTHRESRGRGRRKPDTPAPPRRPAPPTVVRLGCRHTTGCHGEPALRQLPLLPRSPPPTARRSTWAPLTPRPGSAGGGGWRRREPPLRRWPRPHLAHELLPGRQAAL